MEMLNLLIFFVFAASIAYFYINYKYSYWKTKGVTDLNPIFPLGNAPTSLPKGLSIGLVSKTLYDKFKPTGCKLGGIYFGLKPALLIMDPKYAEDILKTDFSYFVDRGTYMSKKHPITDNIFTRDGNEWRTTRAKLNGMFTIAKMKMIFETFKACSVDLEEHLEKCAQKGEYVNVMEIMCSYNTDIISSVVFGIECNSFKNSDSVFREIGRMVFAKFPIKARIQMYLATYWQDMAKKLGVSNIQEGVADFFYSLIKDTVNYREKNNVYRMDFLQLLMDSRKENNISLEEIAAQIFIFFVAGFETSAGSSTHLLFALATNKEVQLQVREEIKTVLRKYDNKIHYGIFKEMPLFDRAFKETSRLYPISSTTLRVCSEDYTFKDSDVTIPKGMKVFIPFFAYQRDPDYFSDPLKWDPDRFLDKKQKHLGYLPFGLGPRNCIGMNFATLQVKMGVISVLKNYRVTADPTIKLPLEFDKDSFLMRSTQPLKMKFQKDD